MNSDATSANNAEEPQQQAQAQAQHQQEQAQAQYSGFRPRYRQRPHYNNNNNRYRQFPRYPPPPFQGPLGPQVPHGFVPFVHTGYDPNQNQYPMVHLMEVPPPLPLSFSPPPLQPTAPSNEHDHDPQHHSRDGRFVNRYNPNMNQHPHPSYSVFCSYCRMKGHHISDCRRTKRRICNYWSQGVCKYMNASPLCPFAHGQGDIRRRPRTTTTTTPEPEPVPVTDSNSNPTIVESGSASELDLDDESAAASEPILA